DFHVTGVQTCALPICLLIRNQCFPLQIPRFTVQQEMVNFDLDSDHTKTPPYSQRIRGRSSTYAEMFIALEPHLFGVLVGICSLRSEERRVGKEGRYCW